MEHLRKGDPPGPRLVYQSLRCPLQPVRMHNWEMVLHFHVHGQGKNLFGDGFAVWYTKEHGELGHVFGNRDLYTGLGVFFDTYSNQNGEHSVSDAGIVGVALWLGCWGSLCD